MVTQFMPFPLAQLADVEKLSNHEGPTLRVT